MCLNIVGNYISIHSAIASGDQAVWFLDCGQEISIHSAIASGDIEIWRNNGGNNEFQSTPPSLAETYPGEDLFGLFPFQSTPPSLAETTGTAYFRGGTGISIHSAIASGDDFWFFQPAEGRYFNPLRHR